MRLGIHFVNFTLPGGPPAIAGTLAATAKAAEEGGCTWFSVMDHWFQMEELGGAQEPMLEGYTTLGYLAAVTSTIDLGLLVTGVTYRHPGLLAKQVATLDVLSGGRAVLAIGAGWYEREHAGLGVPFPPVPERLGRLEETLQICRQMWSDDDGPFDGAHNTLAETICSPRPLQDPRPRIIVGGGGERRLLRLVARYADGWNFFGTSPAAVGHKIDVLARHCEAEGRDPASVTKTILALGDPLADVEAFVSTMDEYARLGIEHVQVMPMGPDPVGIVRRLGDEVVPRLAQISPG